MEFRLHFPRSTPARCVACKILGGVDIETEDDASLYKEAAEYEGEDAPKVGDFLELDPCVPKHTLGWYEEKKGRPCPRVVMTEENYALTSVVMMSVGEMTRPHAPALFESLFPLSDPDERVTYLRRIGNCIASEPMQEWLKQD